MNLTREGKEGERARAEEEEEEEEKEKERRRRVEQEEKGIDEPSSHHRSHRLNIM